MRFFLNFLVFDFFCLFVCLQSINKVNGCLPGGVCCCCVSLNNNQQQPTTTNNNQQQPTTTITTTTNDNDNSVGNVSGRRASKKSRTIWCSSQTWSYQPKVFFFFFILFPFFFCFFSPLFVKPFFFPLRII